MLPPGGVVHAGGGIIHVCLFLSMTRRSSENVYEERTLEWLGLMNPDYFHRHDGQALDSVMRLDNHFGLPVRLFEYLHHEEHYML